MSLWEITTTSVAKLWVLIVTVLVLTAWIGWNEREINRGKNKHDLDGWLPFLKQVWDGRRNGR